MKWVLVSFQVLILAGYSLLAQEIESIRLKPGRHMNRADLHIWNPTKKPQAVLVLSPGYNGNGITLIRKKEWQKFALDHSLALVGLSFASDFENIPPETGYYHASQNSGQLLLQGLKKAFGKDLQLLLYGFSGGAHFTSRFVEWKPERVIAWCSYSAAWWDEPRPAEVNPMGIVACGEKDFRLGASLVYFKQGRASGKPWLWVGIPGNDHSPAQQMESFVRNYFEAVLNSRKSNGVWIDIDFGNTLSSEEAANEPSLSGWLPDKNLRPQWLEISNVSEAGSTAEEN